MMRPLRVGCLSLLLLAVVALGCLRSSRRDAGRNANPVVPSSAPAAPGAAAAASGSVMPVERRVELRGEAEKGVPLHPAPRDRSISGRLPDRTAAVVLETTPDGHWLHVRADDGTDGWVIEKYVGGKDICPTAAPGPQNVFVEAAPGEAVSIPGTQIAAGDTLTVVSYNLWELYDGRGGDRYLGEREHPEGAALDEAHATRRIAALAGALKGAAADVFVFQEVENAALACVLARAAAGEGAWTCWASDWAPEPHPQNVAVASRVPGAVLELDPGPGMGQRGALEFTLDGGALRIAAVHLKSSVGASGAEDCGNAAKRMAVAHGLLERRRSFPDAAYLVIGDLNVDPGDAAKEDYDLTGEILARDGGEDLVRRFLGEAPDVRETVWGSVIDRAFLRRGSGIDAASLRFAVAAPLGGWASDHRPLVVVLRLPR